VRPSNCMKTEEFETRNTLLDHYSSKSSDHAMQLLTLALIVVGLVAARPQPYVIVLVLPAVFAGALWVAGRMFYWGYLCYAILHVPDGLAKELGTDALKTKYYEPTLESMGLHLGAVAAVAHYHKRWTWFSSLGNWKIFVLCVVYVVLAFLFWAGLGFL
jgi:hypothetical protein